MTGVKLLYQARQGVFNGAKINLTPLVEGKTPVGPFIELGSSL
jgi:hypothetical protein